MEGPRHTDGHCPSDLLLDRYVAGELEGSKRAELEQHLSSCSVCQSLLEQRRAEADAFRTDPSLPARARATLAQLAAERAHSAKPRRAWSRARLWVPGLALAASAALLLMLLLPRHAGDLEPFPAGGRGSVRVKGAFALGAFLKRGPSVSQAQSGQVFHPNDELRFTYSTDRGGFLCLLGLDAKGTVTIYFPSRSETAARVAATSASAPLPEATLLDETLGREWVLGVLCPHRFEVKQVQRSNLSQLIAAAKGGDRSAAGLLPSPACKVALFELLKERPDRP